MAFLRRKRHVTDILQKFTGRVEDRRIKDAFVTFLQRKTTGKMRITDLFET